MSHRLIIVGIRGLIFKTETQIIYELCGKCGTEITICLKIIEYLD